MDDLVKCDLVWDELHHLVKAFRTPKMAVASRGFNEIVCSSCLGCDMAVLRTWFLERLYCAYFYAFKNVREVIASAT